MVVLGHFGWKTTPRSHSCQCIRVLILLTECVFNPFVGDGSQEGFEVNQRRLHQHVNRIIWTTLIVSISTIRLLRLYSHARVSTSLKAHSSAMKLLVKPKLLEKLIFQSLISPPPPYEPLPSTYPNQFFKKKKKKAHILTFIYLFISFLRKKYIS